MGLAAPRKRVKLSQDPNNTQWTRDTQSFGHKIMSAQGWQPGEILGAKNASHAEFHTAANASHIRVFVKDDNLGLGAKKGSGLAEGECTGLDVFQSLLGRLNGKDEDELTKEQKSREDLKRALYTEQRWGSVQFVKGGFLVGEKIQELIDSEENRVSQLTRNFPAAVVETSEHDTEPISKLQSSNHDKKNKRKNRKAEKEQHERIEKRVKAMNKSDEGTNLKQDVPQDDISTPPKKSKTKEIQFQETEIEVNTADSNEEYSSRKSKKNKRKRKQEEREAKKLTKGGASARYPIVPQSVASPSGSSTPQSLLGGRHAVRSRNITQKRLAVLDTASLNQIFMIKQ